MNQNLINIQGANTTISSNIFSGQYTLATNDHTSRALEVSTTSGLNISGNQFNNLRQPAYINDGFCRVLFQITTSMKHVAGWQWLTQT